MDLFIGWASTWNAQKDDEIKEFPPTTKPIRYLSSLESEVFHEPNCFVEPSGGGDSYFFSNYTYPSWVSCRVLDCLETSFGSQVIKFLVSYQASSVYHLYSTRSSISILTYYRFKKYSCIRHRSVIIVMRRPKRETLTALCRNQITHLNPVSACRNVQHRHSKKYGCVQYILYTVLGDGFFVFLFFW